MTSEEIVKAIRRQCPICNDEGVIPVSTLITKEGKKIRIIVAPCTACGKK